LATALPGAGQAELTQQHHIAPLERDRRLGRQPVMRRRVAGIERRERALRQAGHHLDSRGEFGRHGGQRAGEGRQKPDLAAQAERFLDRRLIRLQHRQRREVPHAGLDAGGEGGTGEEDGIGPGSGGVARQRQEALRHCLRQPPFPCEVGREAVIQQVHQPRLGPGGGEGGLDRRWRMTQRVDQGDSHG
jgi:hypothetical protein